MQLYHPIIHKDLERTYFKITFTRKIKTTNNQFEQSKTRCNLDRYSAKILSLSSGSISKYEFLKGENVLPQKDLKN